MNFTPIILAFEPVKKENKMIVYGVIEEVGLVVNRIIKLDDHKTPCAALESLFKEDPNQEKYATEAFALPNDEKWIQDKEELLTAFYAHDAGKLKEEKKLLNSVMVCLIRIGYIQISVDEVLSNTKVLYSYSNIRRICSDSDRAKAQFKSRGLSFQDASRMKNRNFLQQVDKSLAK